jgi:hypothetical protein
MIAAPLSRADVVQVPTQNEQTYSIQLPGRGMTMTKVEERFGQPLKKYDAVGDPPITRWDYADFSVYFEYQYVIDAVINKQ